MMTFRELGQELWDSHRGKLVGMLLGLFVALLIMWVGVFWTLFILACVGLGYVIGKRMDDHKENLAEVLDRILPPGANE